MSTKPKRDRRILPGELARLHVLAKPVDAAREVVEDAVAAHNVAKAAHDVVAIQYQREAARLVAKYRLKADEQIDPQTGVIQKKPKA